MIFPHIPEVIWTTINFIVLLLILKKYLFGPLLGMMNSREQEIEENLAKAAEDKSEAERLRADLTEQLANASREAQRILGDATRAANATREQLEADARAKAEEIISRAQESVRREKEKAVAELRQEFANLVVLAAGKVIDRELKVDDHTRLVHQFVEEVGKH